MWIGLNRGSIPQWPYFRWIVGSRCPSWSPNLVGFIYHKSGIKIPRSAHVCCWNMVQPWLDHMLNHHFPMDVLWFYTFFSFSIGFSMVFLWFSWCLRGFACHGGAETDLALLTQSQHSVAGIGWDPAILGCWVIFLWSDNVLMYIDVI